MTMQNVGRLFITAVALMIGGSVFAQGMYWESTTSGGALGDKVMQSKNFTVPKKFRHEGGDGQVLIVRLDKEMLYFVTPKEKQYSETTFAELEATMKRASTEVDARMAEVQEQMKDMPEEQRKMIEKMMPGKMGKKKDAPVDVARSGEKKMVSGYSCSKYTASMNDKEIVTAWTTKDIKGFEAMKRDWQEFGRRMALLNPMNGNAMAEAFMKMDGFAMEMNVEGITTVVTKIEARMTPPSEFEIPAGYTKTDSPLKKMGK